MNTAQLFMPRERWVQCAQVACVVLAGLLIRIAFIQSPGYRDDLTIFYEWLKAISVLPPSQVYAHVPSLNYPPMSVVFYELSATVLRWFDHGQPSEYAMNVALKLPPIIFDALGAVLAYAIVRRNAAHAMALLAAAYFSFNPAIIYDSAYWGQNDSIPAVLALFAISALLQNKTMVAWLAITAAVFVKPPVLVLVPLMLAHPFAVQGPLRRRRLLDTAFGLLGACFLAEALAFVFFPHPTIFAAARNLTAQLISGSSFFSFNSLNAFNVWAIFQPFFVTDRERFLSLSLHVWGYLFFIASAGFVYWRYTKRRDAQALFEASTIVLLAPFLFLTEMHERYLIYAVIFCGVALAKKPYGYAALILSVTLLLNLEYGLTFMYLDDARATMVDRYEFAPWLVHLCSVANIGAFCWLLAEFVRSPPAEWTITGGVWRKRRRRAFSSPRVQ